MYIILAKRLLVEKPLSFAWVDDMRRITRLDNQAKRMVGWRVQYWVAGQEVRQFFSDAKFGGKDEAYKAAEACASSHIHDHDEINNLFKKIRLRKNTKFGLSGVTRVERRDGSSPFWVAYWTEQGRKKSKKFSVWRHGEFDAMSMAISIRLEHVKQETEKLAELLARHKKLT